MRGWTVFLVLIFASMTANAQTGAVLPAQGPDETLARVTTGLLYSEILGKKPWETVILHPEAVEPTCMGRDACLANLAATAGYDHIIVPRILHQADGIHLELGWFDKSQGMRSMMITRPLGDISEAPLRIPRIVNILFADDPEMQAAMDDLGELERASRESAARQQEVEETPQQTDQTEEGGVELVSDDTADDVEEVDEDFSSLEEREVLERDRDAEGGLFGFTMESEIGAVDPAIDGGSAALELLDDDEDTQRTGSSRDRETAGEEEENSSRYRDRRIRLAEASGEARAARRAKRAAMQIHEGNKAFIRAALGFTGYYLFGSGGVVELHGSARVLKFLSVGGGVGVWLFPWDIDSDRYYWDLQVFYNVPIHLGATVQLEKGLYRPHAGLDLVINVYSNGTDGDEKSHVAVGPRLRLGLDILVSKRLGFTIGGDFGFTGADEDNITTPRSLLLQGFDADANPIRPGPLPRTGLFGGLRAGLVVRI